MKTIQPLILPDFLFASEVLHKVEPSHCTFLSDQSRITAGSAIWLELGSEYAITFIHLTLSLCKSSRKTRIVDYLFDKNRGSSSVKFSVSFEKETIRKPEPKQSRKLLPIRIKRNQTEPKPFSMDAYVQKFEFVGVSWTNLFFGLQS